MHLERRKDGQTLATKSQGSGATDSFSGDKGGVNGLLTEASGATAAFSDEKVQLSAGLAIRGLCPNICIKLFIFSDSVKSSDVEPAIETCSIGSGKKRESIVERSREP